MSSANKNLSDYSPLKIAIKNKVIAIVVSEWNGLITESLYLGASGTLRDNGFHDSGIIRINVPGSFELSLGAQKMAQRKDIDAIICLGCVIKGETKHFDFICQAVAMGITEVSLKYDKPVVFGLLTPNNQKQAEDRAGGKYGNKGDEAAITAIKMLQL